MCGSTSASVRGMSFNILFLDEFCRSKPYWQMRSLPLFILLLLLVNHTKVIIVSTPHGMNHFYRMWMMQRRVRMNMYRQTFTGRKYQVEMKSGKNKLSRTHRNNKFKIEFECEFLGSIDTLIAVN